MRHAARVVLLNADDRLLLIQCASGRGDGHFWITPGGGLEGDETHEQAATRELAEEIGLTGVPLGPCLWTRVHTFPWGGRVLEQHERLYLCRVDHHEPRPTRLSAEEQRVLSVMRWWTLAEITEATAAGELFSPRDLAARLQALLRDGPPARPCHL
jgi:8-oxo-dGTP pyrophosphatase MutT (NUDIX family)